MHGFSVARCCRGASETVLRREDQYIKAFLGPFFPVYFPVNWQDCFVAMCTHRWLPAISLVDGTESESCIILDCIRWFDEQDVARQFLARLTDAKLRCSAQEIRARTNFLAILRRPLVRSARVELLREFPKPERFGSSGGRRLDLEFRIACREYEGSVEP